VEGRGQKSERDFRFANANFRLKLLIASQCLGGIPRFAQNDGVVVEDKLCSVPRSFGYAQDDALKRVEN